nr:CASP-like protein 4A1 [Aegilops tauschii subsp. strangulata]
MALPPLPSAAPRVQPALARGCPRHHLLPLAAPHSPAAHRLYCSFALAPSCRSAAATSAPPRGSTLLAPLAGTVLCAAPDHPQPRPQPRTLLLRLLAAPGPPRAAPSPSPPTPGHPPPLPGAPRAPGRAPTRVEPYQPRPAMLAG